jgi:hypothetical protein
MVSFSGFPRWLTTSVTAQRLTIEVPYRERQVGLSGDILARFTSNFTLQLTGGATRNQVTGVISPQLIVLLYVKPVF